MLWLDRGPSGSCNTVPARLTTNAASGRGNLLLKIEFVEFPTPLLKFVKVPSAVLPLLKDEVAARPDSPPPSPKS